MITLLEKNIRFSTPKVLISIASNNLGMIFAERERERERELSM